MVDLSFQNRTGKRKEVEKDQKNVLHGAGELTKPVHFDLKRGQLFALLRNVVYEIFNKVVIGCFLDFDDLFEFDDLKEGSKRGENENEG